MQLSSRAIELIIIAEKEEYSLLIILSYYRTNQHAINICLLRHIRISLKHFLKVGFSFCNRSLSTSTHYITLVVCESQHAQVIITLSIIHHDEHHCHTPLSPHFPACSLKQDSEACGGGYGGLKQN